MRSAATLLVWIYLIASTAAFIVYRRDKSAAERGGRRTPEIGLHVLGLIGGWPGGLLAQKLFRHKSSKPSFQLLFWMTVALNCAALVWWWWARV